MRKNKLKKMFKEGKPIVNGWLQIPSAFSAEVMAHQGWDSCTIDMQHGVIDYPNALNMLQAISTTETIPLARVNWNESGQIMKILDAGCYGIICPMVSNRKEAENFVQACLYPSKGYRSFGPIRGLLYGGSDYAKHADNEILKLAMIETKEALEKLDEILDTPNLDGIYIGPADLSLAVGEEPGFDRPESTTAYKEILRILEAAKKRGIAVTNTPEVLSDATAEIGILLILGACRRAAEGIESAREGGWKWSADYLIGKQLTGTRLGVLGMGRIGQKIARIAKSLGMIIHYHNRSKLSEEKEQGAIYHDNLKSLFSVSDVLSICCPATKETENMINKETVEYFPKGAVITNVARGDIVDDDALIDALNRRKIYAAGLDVYKNEPNLNPGYLKIKSAFILPHLGSATKDTRIAMANLAIDNIDEFFKTGNCTNKVN